MKWIFVLLMFLTASVSAQTVSSVVIVSAASGGEGPPPSLTYDNASYSSLATGSTNVGLSWSHTNSAQTQRLIVIAVTYYCDNKPIVDSVKYAGVNATYIGRATSTDSLAGVKWWYVNSAATGANNVQVWAHGSTNVDMAAAAISFYGVNATTPLGTMAGVDFSNEGNCGGLGPHEMNVTSVSGDIVVDAMLAWGATSVTTDGTNQTKRIDQYNSDLAPILMSTMPAVGTTTTTGWCFDDAHTGDHVGIAVKP